VTSEKRKNDASSMMPRSLSSNRIGMMTMLAGVAFPSPRADHDLLGRRLLDEGRFCSTAACRASPWASMSGVSATPPCRP
jgi:hypothetical protein